MGNGYNGGTGYIETANVNGGEVVNGYGYGSTGYIETANVNGGWVWNGYNGGTGYIETANVNGGEVYNGYDSYNGGTGTITTANVYGGAVYNGSRYDTGYITTANVYGGAVYNNGSSIVVGGGSIETANVYDGEVSNGSYIETANVYGGYVDNGGSIDTANVYDGEVRNGVGHYVMGTIETANVYGGTLYNGHEGGYIGTATMTGGTVNNYGRIEELNYFGGTYESGYWDYNDNWEWSYLGIGTIGTLNYNRDINVITVHYGYTYMSFLMSSLLNDFGGSNLVEAVNANVVNVYGEGEGTFVNDFFGGTITTANVYGGYVHNGSDGGTGYIETANIYGGEVYNGFYDGGTGYIETANIYGGLVVNLATASDNGELYNVSTINHATVSDNGELHNGGTINNATFSDNGYLYNIGTINNAAVSDNGYLHNDKLGTFNGTINNVTMNGGTVENWGRIEELTYTSGTYVLGGDWGYNNNWGLVYLGGGTIGVLNFDVSGNMRTDSWSMFNIFGGRDCVEKIGSVNVYDRGYFHTGVTIDTATVSGNGILVNVSTINNATVSGNGTLNNEYGTINNATVSDNGTLYNYHYGYEHGYDEYGGGYLYPIGGTIDHVTVNGGELYNAAGEYLKRWYFDEEIDSEAWILELMGGIIDSVLLNGGLVGNIGYIDTLTYTGGIYNGREIKTDEGYIQQGEGMIGTLNVAGNSTGITWENVVTINVQDGGKVSNYNSISNGWNARLETVNIYDGGSVSNYNEARLETANVYGGSLENTGGASIGTLALDGGLVNNNVWNGIDNAVMTGGTLNNSGRIGNLTYIDGTYNGSMWHYLYGYGYEEYGSIGTLTLAGNSAVNPGDWGIVENLQFADDGSGILAISAVQTRSAVSFVSDIRPTDSVDLTFGNIVIDWNGALSEGVEFSLMDIFGIDDVFGTLNTLSIGEQQFSYVGSDWAFTFADGAWRSGNEVPEPATLAMVALGLAGLGLARRRRS